ncbi:MAG: hypothetical protein HFF64_09255 [Oscillospiraceae bacterium]|nr:hypothetical protein [Oscillospiraceae bacterium]
MEFVFRLSDYGDPALDGEAARLLEQRLEAHSRKAAPGVWRWVDRLRSRAAGGQERRRRLYGAVLLALGVFLLVPGLAEPGSPVLIGAGVLGTVYGSLLVLLTREKRPSPPPASCQREAAKLLEQRRGTDWSGMEGRLCVDGSGLSADLAGKREHISFGEMTGAFESEQLWLLVCGGERAILLQKKDLIAGEAEKFLPYLWENITNQGSNR